MSYTRESTKKSIDEERITSSLVKEIKNIQSHKSVSGKGKNKTKSQNKISPGNETEIIF